MHLDPEAHATMHAWHESQLVCLNGHTLRPRACRPSCGPASRRQPGLPPTRSPWAAAVAAARAPTLASLMTAAAAAGATGWQLVDKLPSRVAESLKEQPQLQDAGATPPSSTDQVPPGPPRHRAVLPARTAALRHSDMSEACTCRGPAHRHSQHCCCFVAHRHTGSACLQANLSDCSCIVWRARCQCIPHTSFPG